MLAPSPMLTFPDHIIPRDARTALLEVFDVSGKLMKSVTLDHTGKGTINVYARDLTPGSYGYRLIVDGVQVDAYKMVVQK